MKLQIFDPVIYPIKLCIAVNPNESLSNFINLEDTVVKLTDDANIPMRVYNKTLTLIENDNVIILATTHNSELLTVSEIAHEATHIARFIWDYLGEEEPGIEADAYLVGWIAKCINEL